MLKIASYSLRVQKVRVKLKCTCGEGRVFEVEEQGELHFYCTKCRARKTLQELKIEASTYWRSRDWVVECETDQRSTPRIHVDYDCRVSIKATRYSPSYCVLHGRMVVLSESGALVVVNDFKEDFFQDITTTYRHAEIELTESIEDLPAVLIGRVVGVRFRPDELPKCRIGVAFDSLGDPSIRRLHTLIEAKTPRSAGLK